MRNSSGVKRFHLTTKHRYVTLHDTIEVRESFQRHNSYPTPTPQEPERTRVIPVQVSILKITECLVSVSVGLFQNEPQEKSEVEKSTHPT